MKNCFIICPIGEKGSEIRRVSDIVLKYIIYPVCEEYGYEVIRADKEFTSNSINDDIFNHLDNDELAIADLTGFNPNVFYEAGYRKAKGLPLIHIAREGTVLPFDIKTIRTYFYDIDVDKVDIAKDALKKVIENIMEKSFILDESDINNNAQVSSVTSIYEKFDVEVSNVYKLPIARGYDYIFKINVYNNAAPTSFVTNIDVEKSGFVMPLKKEKLKLIESVSHTGNVETGRKALISQPIPFKVLHEDFVSGYFELLDKNNDININENDTITLRVNFGKKVFEKEYIIPNIEHWNKIEF